MYGFAYTCIGGSSIHVDLMDAARAVVKPQAPPRVTLAMFSAEPHAVINPDGGFERVMVDVARAIDGQTLEFSHARKELDLAYQVLDPQTVDFMWDRSSAPRVLQRLCLYLCRCEDDDPWHHPRRANGLPDPRVSLPSCWPNRPLVRLYDCRGTCGRLLEPGNGEAEWLLSPLPSSLPPRGGDALGTARWACRDG